MSGDYDHFQEVYAVKKAQLEAAYRRQQQEISRTKGFCCKEQGTCFHQKHGDVPSEKAGQDGCDRAGGRKSRSRSLISVMARTPAENAV